MPSHRSQDTFPNYNVCLSKLIAKHDYESFIRGNVLILKWNKKFSLSIQSEWTCFTHCKSTPTKRLSIKYCLIGFSFLLLLQTFCAIESRGFSVVSFVLCNSTITLQNALHVDGFTFVIAHIKTEGRFERGTGECMIHQRTLTRIQTLTQLTNSLPG